MENYNKEHGTILDRLVVIKIWSDNKKDYIRYIYSHDSGEHGPYTAYVPKGQIVRLGLQERNNVSYHHEKNCRKISLGQGDKTKEGNSNRGTERLRLWKNFSTK